MLKEVLNRKKILFIGVQFYEYHLEIKKKMEEYGAQVIFFPERDTSIKYGIVNRLFHSYIDQYQLLHYSKILKQTKDEKFDYLFVIRGFKMPLSFVREIKQRNPGIKTIMYQWDANANSPFVDVAPQYSILKEFDKLYSFDLKDVEDFPFLKYSPTFHTDEFKRLSVEKSSSQKYDFFYFGSYLPERYQGLLHFKKFAEDHGYSLKTHFYMSYRYYLIERMKGVPLDKRNINFKPMTRTEYFENFKQSKVIVDVSNARQTGMAMRVIDAIGAGKKVLTTNSWITRSPGFNPKQIAIIDINNIQVSKDFLDQEIETAPIDYSIQKFLENLFC